jgi:hypothetical protein
MWEAQTNCVRPDKGICIGNLQFDQQFFLFVLDNDAHWSHFAQAFHMLFLLEIAISDHICTSIVKPNKVRWSRDVLSHF